MGNLGLWVGLAASLGVLAWSLLNPGAGRNMLDPQGLFIVLGGLAGAALVSTPAAQLRSALGSLAWTLLPRLPAPAEVAAEIARLSRKARAEGGLLALRGENPDFAGGFLRRAVDAAAACGETDAAREILNTEIRRLRVHRQEDANVLRTLGTLAPMFGLLGTLAGMLEVLTAMSEPARLGPAMALALSSAFVGIGTATFLCVPLAGQIRGLAMRESLLLDMIAAGVLEIAANRPTYEIELLMGAYLDEPPAAANAP